MDTEGLMDKASAKNNQSEQLKEETMEEESHTGTSIDCSLVNNSPIRIALISMLFLLFV